MNAPPVSPAAPHRAVQRSKDLLSHAGERVGAYFRERDPTIRAAFGPFLLLSAFLFVRSPFSNYIFDEQQALLANPFVNGKVPFRDVLTRDFWGLPHDRSIGSYRPLPNIIWRAFWKLGTVFHYPWALHWINIVIHALNAACVARIALGLTRDRSTAWFAGVTFAACAVLTEAVTGVVGIADVLGALGLLLAVLALEASLPKMAPLVFITVALGLFSKESTLVAIPILFWAALLSAPLHHPSRPLRFARAVVALVSATLALVLYTQTRRHFFPTDLPDDLKVPLASTDPWFRRGFHAFLQWFQQPRLPQDPINNPLIRADTLHRVSGALGVYASGVGQVLFPFTLSGDYSFAAEPIPEHVMNPRAFMGALLLLGPPLAGLSLWLSAVASELSLLIEGARGRIVVAIALVWAPVAYFPHSNIPVTLPTVRAERFWYLPAAGIALALGVLFAWLCRQPRERLIGQWGPAFVALFLGFSSGARACSRARLFRRPRLLASDGACRPEERESPLELRRHARRARQIGGAARRKPARDGARVHVAHGAHLLRGHALPVEPRGRSVASLQSGRRSSRRTIATFSPWRFSACGITAPHRNTKRNCSASQRITPVRGSRISRETSSRTARKMAASTRNTAPAVTTKAPATETVPPRRADARSADRTSSRRCVPLQTRARLSTAPAIASRRSARSAMNFREGNGPVERRAPSDVCAVQDAREGFIVVADDRYATRERLEIRARRISLPMRYDEEIDFALHERNELRFEVEHAGKTHARTETESDDLFGNHGCEFAVAADRHFEGHATAVEPLCDGDEMIDPLHRDETAGEREAERFAERELRKASFEFFSGDERRRGGSRVEI